MSNDDVEGMFDDLDDHLEQDVAKEVKENIVKANDTPEEVHGYQFAVMEGLTTSPINED